MVNVSDIFKRLANIEAVSDKSKYPEFKSVLNADSPNTANALSLPYITINVSVPNDAICILDTLRNPLSKHIHPVLVPGPEGNVMYVNTPDSTFAVGFNSDAIVHNVMAQKNTVRSFFIVYRFLLWY